MRLKFCPRWMPRFVRGRMNQRKEVISQSSIPPRMSTPSSRTCRRIWRLPVMTNRSSSSNSSGSRAVRIQKARTALLLDHPFFGSLLFRLGGRSSTSIETMATDGVSIYYNPGYVETLSAAELAGVLAHEVMHPALQHHTSRGDRDHARWNMACDYAINPMLLDAGLTLPKDVLIDNRFRGMSAERIYNLIEEDDKQEGSTG